MELFFSFFDPKKWKIIFCPKLFFQVVQFPRKSGKSLEKFEQTILNPKKTILTVPQKKKMVKSLAAPTCVWKNSTDSILWWNRVISWDKIVYAPKYFWWNFEHVLITWWAENNFWRFFAGGRQNFWPPL